MPGSAPATTFAAIENTSKHHQKKVKMKKLLLAVLVIGFPAFMLSSCNDDNEGSGAYDNTITVAGVTEQVARAYYGGGSSQVAIGIGTDSYSITAQALNGKTVDLTSRTQPWGIEFVVSGAVSDTTYEGSVDDPDMITGGKLYMKLDGDNVEIRFEFTTTDGKTMKGNYKGKASMWD